MADEGGDCDGLCNLSAEKPRRLGGGSRWQRQIHWRAIETHCWSWQLPGSSLYLKFMRRWFPAIPLPPGLKCSSCCQMWKPDGGRESWLWKWSAWPAAIPLTRGW